jgi:hypothetical protein
VHNLLQTTASEATFVCLLAGRTEAIRRYREQDEDLEDAEINSRLVAYCSDQVRVVAYIWMCEISVHHGV